MWYSEYYLRKYSNHVNKYIFSFSKLNLLEMSDGYP